MWVIGAKHLLRGKERLPIQRLRIVISTLVFIERTQVVLSISKTRMDWPKGVRPNGTGAHKEPFSLPAFAPFLIECRQVIQTGCEQEGTLARHGIDSLKQQL